MVNKTSVRVNRLSEEIVGRNTQRFRLARVIPILVTNVELDGSFSSVAFEAPWFLKALSSFGAHLERQGFTDGLRAIGEANAQAHRAAGYVSTHSFGTTIFAACAGIAWYRKGANGRDWFFHAAFSVDGYEERGNVEVTFFNSLDPHGRHLHPDCLKSAE